MKKTKKKILIFLALIAICISLYFMVSIYAKYLTEASGNTAIPISRWNIMVNNTSIRENKDFSAGITPVFPGNEYIASNIIAPSAEGYFDLVFNFTDVDVSFKYDITVAVNPDSPVQDLVATKYSVDSGALIDLKSADEHITDTILYTSENKTRTIRIYVKWAEDDTSIMDNAADTATTLSDAPALFKSNVSFTQITEANP